MTTYILRRLLLMIPTLFGVTIVAFIVMKMAPGDPLLNSGDARGDARAASRDLYLTQKRALGLDKPFVVNLNGFRDFGPALQSAAEILGTPLDELTKELPKFLDGSQDPNAGQRLKFVNRLKIPDFAVRLQDPQQQSAAARSLVDFTQVWCEDLGASGVPAAIGLLRDKNTPSVERRGAIHALNHMISDPFVYAYGRAPRDDETPTVLATWRLWRDRHQQEIAAELKAPSTGKQRELEQTLQHLSAADSRTALMDGLEKLHREDAPFFVEKLLGDSTLAEKNVASLVLRLYIGKPLKTDVGPDADAKQLNEVTENWITHYETFRSRYEPNMRRKLYDLIANTQYAQMVTRLVTFNFGPSAIGTHESVGAMIWRAVRVTGPLMLGSEALIYLIAVPLGIVCAVNRNRFWDRSISFVLFVLYSVPTFVAAMILLLLCCYGGLVKWFPMSGLHSPGADEFSWGIWLLDYCWHAFLPVVCLSLFSLAGLAMYARASMLDVISEDFIRTARAKGVRERGVVWHHALRNALIPVITLFADFLPAMLGGSVLIEVLFSIPGMGRLSWASIAQKDYPTLMALIYIDAVVVLLSILLSDLLYYVVDPRINLESAGEAIG